MIQSKTLVRIRVSEEISHQSQWIMLLRSYIPIDEKKEKKRKSNGWTIVAGWGGGEGQKTCNTLSYCCIVVENWQNLNASTWVLHTCAKEVRNTKTFFFFFCPAAVNFIFLPLQRTLFTKQLHQNHWGNGRFFLWGLVSKLWSMRLGLLYKPVALSMMPGRFCVEKVGVTAAIDRLVFGDNNQGGWCQAQSGSTSKELIALSCWPLVFLCR